MKFFIFEIIIFLAVNVSAEEWVSTPSWTPTANPIVTCGPGGSSSCRSERGDWIVETSSGTYRLPSGTNSINTETGQMYNRDGQLTGTHQGVLQRPAGQLGPCNSGNCNSVAKGEPTGSSNSTPDQVEAAAACKSAHRAAMVSCDGLTYSAAIVPLLQQFKSSSGGNNVKKACEDAAQLNKIGGFANLGFAIACQTSQKKCVAKCNEEKIGSAAEYDLDRYIDDCDRQERTAQMAYFQVALSASQFLGSQACADAASGKCVGDNAFNDVECIQFCQKPGRQEHPKCVQTIASCSDTTYRSQNAQLCNCLTNLSAPGCGGLQIPPLTVPTVANNEIDPFANLDEFPGVDEFTGNPTNLGTGSKVDSSGGGGGGFGGGGGGSAPFGQNDGQGDGGDEALNKDILGGQGSGSGVPIGGGGGGYENNGGGGGNRRGSGSDKDSPGFDLRAFLPGGKKDPKRGLASTGYSDQSITPANGLTNFEKVTKRMNQKMPELELKP